MTSILYYYYRYVFTIFYSYFIPQFPWYVSCPVIGTNIVANGAGFWGTISIYLEREESIDTKIIVISYVNLFWKIGNGLCTGQLCDRMVDKNNDSWLDTPAINRYFFCDDTGVWQMDRTYLPDIFMPDERPYTSCVLPTDMFQPKDPPGILFHEFSPNSLYYMFCIFSVLLINSTSF